MTFSFPVISADSHITEPPDCYTAHIDPAWRDRAPHMVSDDARGDMFVIPGMSRPIAMGLVAAAGKPAEELTVSGVSFDELHRSGWDPNYRIADQQRDGVAAEVIYPTVGMMICNHPDADFKHAAFTAYNRWIADYCSVAPDRLLGCGQTALRSVDEGIADLQRIADLGLRGVMMPGEPATWSEDGSGDYDDPMW
ncbi:MAG: amidohydrolase, partial [Actinomycetota bacterium]|nr:amidohydrolase [Actinomycetota bacterium]